MKVLVTGATGYIGSLVIEHFLRTGVEVIASSSSAQKARECGWYDQVTYKEYSIEQAQGASNNLYDYFSKPDFMLHLAWQGLPNYNKQDHIEQNLFRQYFFFQNLIKNGLKDISVTGTCLEYGMLNGCLSENMHTLPGNYYALAKDSLRKLLELTANDYSVNLKWIRLFYMYGGKQGKNSLIPQLEEAISTGAKSFKMSGGEQLRDYLPVETVAEYLCKIAGQQDVTGVINCCSGQPISVRRLVEKYIKSRNSDISLELGYYPYPTYEPLAFWGDNTKLKTIL